MYKRYIATDDFELEDDEIGFIKGFIYTEVSPATVEQECECFEIIEDEIIELNPYDYTCFIDELGNHRLLDADIINEYFEEVEDWKHE